VSGVPRCGNDAWWESVENPNQGFPLFPPQLGNPTESAGFPHSHSAYADYQLFRHNFSKYSRVRPRL